MIYKGKNIMSNAKKCNRCGAPYTIDILDEKDNITAIEPEENCGAINLLMYKIKISPTSNVIWKRLDLFAARNREIQT